MSNINKLIDIYKTPLYVYDFSKIRTQIERLKSTLPPKFQVFYSIKANPSIGLLSYIKEHVSI